VGSELHTGSAVISDRFGTNFSDADIALNQPVFAPGVSPKTDSSHIHSCVVPPALLHKAQKAQTFYENLCAFPGFVPEARHAR
jgi:hypothetical protein